MILKKNTKQLWYYAKYLKPYLKEELLLLIMLLFISSMALVSPYILKIIIDKVFPSKDYEYLMNILLLLVVLYLSRIILSFFTNYLQTLITNKIVRDIRKDLFNHIIQLPISFFSKNNSGDILHRLSSEVNSIQNVISGSLVKFLSNSFTILVVVSMLCYLNLKLFLAVTIIFPFVFLNFKFFYPRITKVVKESREKDSQILSFLSERIANIKIIKSLADYKFENEFLDKIQNEYIDVNLKNVKITSTSGSISTFFMAMAPVIIFGVGGKDVFSGVMTLGSLVAFLQYLNRLFSPLRQMSNLYNDIVRASVSTKRISDFLNEPVNEVSNSYSSIKSFEKIVFENVCFSYDEKDILDNVNLKLDKGKKYALIGESGSGKSTFVDMILGFITPQNGFVKIDECLIQKINIIDWRGLISYMPQESFLFNDTIKSNIDYGNNRDLREVEIVSKIANIYDFIIADEKGFNSIIGDKGVRLSGGQRQRIGIARALLRDSEIIILDEATSALDKKNESLIMNEIMTKFNNKTIIVISHNLLDIEKYDEVIYFEKGKLKVVKNS